MATAFTAAIEAWDKRWVTAEGRADWLDPEPEIIALSPELKARGARTALDLGCGAGRHALVLAEHGLRRRGDRRQCCRPRGRARDRTGSRHLVGRASRDGRCAAVERWQLRFRAVVECDPPRDLGRCRAAADRDLVVRLDQIVHPDYL
jgi:hypothetical protein